jgi:transcriptional regulator with XRE-family HTH domain
MSLNTANFLFFSQREPVSICTKRTMPGSTSKARRVSPDTIRAILAARGLSLAEVSRQSDVRFAGGGLFRIPPNFYDALRRRSFSPSLHQLYALSTLTGFRLADWLHLFGFSFDDPAMFQAAWPQHQTVELDARIYDRRMAIPWFKERHPIVFGTELTPLSHWLSGGIVRTLDSLSAKIGPTFRYLQIGSRDAYAFPDLLPGSIVRIDGRLPSERLLEKKYADCILAVEHSRGVICCRLRRASSNRVILCPRQLPYGPAELELGTNARILGVVDLEIRRVASLEAPTVSTAASRVWKSGESRSSAVPGHVGEWIRRARFRCGLSFREASGRTAEIARILGHPNYFCSAGALSDLETRKLFPRHLHKLISLCAVYCVAIGELMALAGLPLVSAGQEAMPEQFSYGSRLQPQAAAEQPSLFLRTMEDEFKEIPFFLRTALPSILGLPNLSVRDLFWAGATQDLYHPYLGGSAILAVNRKNKAPLPALSSPVWAQPLYVLELRDGNRLCAACSLQDGILIVRPCTTLSGDLLRLRNRVEAEVLGQVVAIVRRLDLPSEPGAPQSDTAP